MTNAVKQRLSQLRALLDILDQRREKANGEHTADLQEKIYAIELAIAHYEAALKIESRIAPLQGMLSWDESDPCRKLPAVVEGPPIRNCRHHRAVAVTGPTPSTAAIF